MTSRQAYQVWGQPCTSSSGGPWPPVTTCWRSPPVSTYRLVNVPVNPSGRFGAPETEPGPSGKDGEFMRNPFTSGTASPSRIGRPSRTSQIPWPLPWSVIRLRWRLRRVRLAGFAHAGWDGLGDGRQGHGHAQDLEPPEGHRIRLKPGSLLVSASPDRFSEIVVPHWTEPMTSSVSVRALSQTTAKTRVTARQCHWSDSAARCATLWGYHT